MIGASCKACGHQYMLDMRHKLTTFIVKNPPEKAIDSQVYEYLLSCGVDNHNDVY